MFRFLVVAFAVSCLAPCGWAQTQPAPTPDAAASATKPPAKKPTAKKTSARPVGPAESGPCQIGVISDIGDQFVVQNVGFTVFGNERSEVPTRGWGLDDLVIARVRAPRASRCGELLTQRMRLQSWNDPDRSFAT
jgi:hypothetical protein